MCGLVKDRPLNGKVGEYGPRSKKVARAAWESEEKQAIEQKNIANSEKSNHSLAQQRPKKPRIQLFDELVGNLKETNPYFWNFLSELPDIDDCKQRDHQLESDWLNTC